MGAFDTYWKEKAEYEKNNKVEMVKYEAPANNPQFSVNALKFNIDNMNNMSDADLRNFIFNSLDSILNKLFASNEAAKYVNYFRDARFLDALTDVIVAKNFLEKVQCIRINTICYHYLTLPDSEKDNAIVSRIIKLSNIVNKTNLPRLLGLGLSENLATMILISRYSDIDFNICVRRVNFVLLTQPKELMSQKMITEIYKCIYNVLEEWYRIFPCIMVDTIPDYSETDNRTWWVTEDVYEINSVMNLSILEILDELPTQTIRNTLVNYTEAISSVYANKRTRFSLRTLSDDFYRINEVINSLEYNENIYVP